MSQLSLKPITPYQASEGEAYMNPQQIKSGLGEDIDRTVHTMQDEATVFADPNDRATQESDISLELRNRDRERKLIKKIDEMLGKINADEYGYCENCGIEIGLGRLEARPTATQCIDCKSLDEIREKQMAK
jgi:DnaK suppressor protein